MSSYLSNLLTQTTSKYNSLRRTLLSSEDDGDTEDDTHICRVLRAYYTEKGRPFPQWLPSDPNDRRSAAPHMYSQQSGYFTSAGGRSQYGGAQQTPGGNRGSLNDLWDPPTAQSNGPVQPQSLRNARRPVNPQPAPSTASLAPQARPLPSQRAGSYQSIASQNPPSRPASGLGGGQQVPPGGSGVAAGSAQERLKARLWGGARAASPGNTPPSNPSSATPNPYDQGGNAYGNRGGSPYDGGGSGQRYGR